METTLIPAWLRPAPDSLWRESERTSGNPRLQLFNYLWSLWAFTAVLFQQPTDASFWWALGIGQAVFSVVFGLIYVRPRGEIRGYALMLALLAYVGVVWNSSAWAYLVFACVYMGVAYFERPLHAIAWMAALQAGLVAWGWGHVPWIVWLMVVGVCSAIGVGNMFGYINRRRNAVLRQSQEEIRQLAASAERERIGRDLHDLLGHTLSLITMKLELSRKLFDRDHERARRELEEAETVARDALAEVRSAVTGMRATDLAAELASTRLLLESSGVQVDCGAPAVELPAATEQALAFIVREAATNIARHAAATRAEVGFAVEAGELHLHVADNGRGGARPCGNGMSGIRERVAAVNGRLDVDSPRKQGTRLDVRVPLATPARGATAAASEGDDAARAPQRHLAGAP